MTSSAPRGSGRPHPLRRVVIGGLLALGVWLAAGLLLPKHVDLARFDGAAVGRLDAAMWRSYYERRPFRLFGQLTETVRVQFHSGFVRAVPIAYHAARAAFIFKDGRNRDEYRRALPALERYFRAINEIAARPFDPGVAARDELEWWIIRRERSRHSTAEWERLIGSVAAEMYHLDSAATAEFAARRVAAMVLRDERGDAISEADWDRIREMLEAGWTSLAVAARSGPLER